VDKLSKGSGEGERDGSRQETLELCSMRE